MLVNLKFLVETVVDYKGDDVENLEEVSDMTLTKVIMVYPEDGEEVAVDITEDVKEFFSVMNIKEMFEEMFEEGLKNL